MKKSILVSLFILVTAFTYGQDKKIDKLELLYSQHHYRLVYNQANRLLNRPEYDYSMMPKFYKSIAIMQLAQNKKNYKKSKYSLEIASNLMKEVVHSTQGKGIFTAHQDEISALKTDLIAWAEDANLAGEKQKTMQIRAILEDFFGEVKIVPAKPVDIDEIAESKAKISDIRAAIIQDAEKLLGTPYVYGGVTSSGFDCSGYTGFVMHANQIDLPRRSEDQYVSAKKVKESNIQPGDLVFFSNGGNVNHVGIVYSKDKDGIYMIHASTSKGVIISEITKDSYWSKRIKGFGTYIK